MEIDFCDWVRPPGVPAKSQISWCGRPEPDLLPFHRPTVARAHTRDELLDAVAGWGVVRQGLRETLECWAAEAASPDAPRWLPLERAQEPPYYALEVQPTITFLDRDGETVPGLFAVGADADGLQDGRYAGGLVLGAVFRPRAADAAVRTSDAGEVTVGRQRP